MDPVVHFEMPAIDRKRMSDFYEKAFGWKTKQYGEDMGNYVVVTTAEMDEKTMMPKEPGRINGGFYQKSADKADQYPSVVISVADIKASMEKITAAGGKIISGPDMIPSVGLYVSFYDTEGNRTSLLQPEPRKG